MSRNLKVPQEHRGQNKCIARRGRCADTRRVQTQAGCGRTKGSPGAAGRALSQSRPPSAASPGRPRPRSHPLAARAAGGSHRSRSAAPSQVIQAVFFGICVLTDLSSLLTRGNDSQEQERQLKKLISLRDWMMAVLAFPVGVFVVTMFWSIYIYDRELVYPKLLDNFIPAWLNHGMHTTVLPFVLIEMRTTHHQYPSRSCGLAAVCTFAVGYILWVCWIHHVTGVWVYPLLEHLSPGVKIIFFAAVTVVINVFYLVGEVLNNYIWDTQKCIEEGREKPKSE
ncbi:androgen-induced gene 1 protein isoform X1 [Zonotrichia albicollis]